MLMEEANKLKGTGKRHLVMGDVVSAVNVLQEACGMLMENGVLGNALMRVPEEEEEKGEEEKPKDSNIESTDNVDVQPGHQTLQQLCRVIKSRLANLQGVLEAEGPMKP
ncbi:hypothetical protein J4Q44_G00271870 [Coregonus suidteri]|uniref:Uncharacterized protein n=1 Tax=Coregonus suidteri TaxID=861788 RepID=A0AAN8L5T8_9TELE